MGKNKAKKPKKAKTVFLYPDVGEVNVFLKESGMGINFPEGLRNPTKMLGPGQGNDGVQTITPKYTGCDHDGSKLVFKLGGKKLFASSWQGLDEYSGNWDLIIDLADNVRPKSTVQGFVKTISSPRFKELEGFVVPTETKIVPSEILSLNWPDMSAPKATLNFWQQLWDMLPATTVVACVGGHGRTGTCLCALLIVNGYSDMEAMELVRKEHCKKAVESFPQEEYLYRIYVEFLEKSLETARFDGDAVLVESLEKTLVEAQASKPKQATSKGSKSWGWSGTQEAPWSMDIMPAEESMISLVYLGHKYTKDCTAVECYDSSCTIKSHQAWVRDYSSINNIAAKYLGI